ncbi:MAG: signal peptide peptidase SppA [Idiomarina sp.]|nr:signal peptide peptidase SppA [Idiomarina sp.]
MKLDRASLKAISLSIARVINSIRRVVVNLVFFVVLIGVILLFTSSEDIPQVTEDSVLVLNPVGILVEQETYVSPVDQFFSSALGGGTIPEVALFDLVSVIDRATHDPKITGLVLDLRYFWGGGLSKLQLVGQHLAKFRDSGKPIVAIGDYYTQSQYYLASFAADILMHPDGSVLLEGYHYYPAHFASMFDKLKLQPHVFRAGDFKTATEPFSRDDMSPEALESTRVWLDDLWTQYLAGVTQNRVISPTALDGQFDSFLYSFEQAQYSLAEYALGVGLIDHITNREEQRLFIHETFGFDPEMRHYPAIEFTDYRRIVEYERSQFKSDAPEIHLIVLRGSIVEGSAQTSQVNANQIVEQLKDARFNEQVKAVVLRIDSPGGSSFGSELIAEQVAALREAGKPVVISMSSTAASGGYWIALGANRIYAPPAAITGSIGVFGMLITAQEGLSHLGIHSDGFSTTEFPYIDLTRDLDPAAEFIIQRNVERAYETFTDHLLTHRPVSQIDLDNIAQGRVWTGRQAHARGLVDELGELSEAIHSAAKLAELKDYQVSQPRRHISGFELFLARLLGSNAQALVTQIMPPSSSDSAKLLQRLRTEVEFLNEFNDPKHIYMRCIECKEF